MSGHKPLATSSIRHGESATFYIVVVLYVMLTEIDFPHKQAALADVNGLTGVTGESGRIQERFEICDYQAHLKAQFLNYNQL